MAKVKAPLLSIGASGKIAGTLVALTWKGLKTMREYVVPANPQTKDQTTQRDAFADCVSAFRNYLTNTDGRTAWDVLAAQAPTPMSGFNVAVKAMLKIIVTNPDASFCNSAVKATTTCVFTMLNIDDGTTGDEAGDFQVWSGDSPSSLLKGTDKPIAAGTITTAALGIATDVVYVKVRKDSQDRSGIFKITLA